MNEFEQFSATKSHAEEIKTSRVGVSARFIISTAKGFICDVDWVNGRTYPECYGFSVTSAQTFTQKRAKVMERICFDNWLDDVKVIKIL